MENIENKLSIIITTYNREILFENTLKSLINTPIQNCRITVLNNCSTDGTLDVCKKYRQYFPEFEVITHPVNLGGGCENYIHAIDYCTTEYMWILADDDIYDFSEFDDVSSAIIRGKADVIHVGALNDGNWEWGCYSTPKELFYDGYNYFGYASFLPCNIFRYNYYVKFIKQAYYGISYRYPHFPCLINLFNENRVIYVSKRRIVTAVWGTQTYSDYIPIRGFLNASKLLENKRDKIKMMLTLSKKPSLLYLFLKYYLRILLPINSEKIQVLVDLFLLFSIWEKFLCILVSPILTLFAYLYSLKK